jgi:hypothetical protein
MKQRVQKSRTTERFVGGKRYAARGKALSGGPNLSWPFAILELQPDRVSVSPRGILKKAFRGVEIPLRSITAVETDFGVSKAGIRFRLEGPADGTVFWTTGRIKPGVIEALRRSGVRVVQP